MVGDQMFLLFCLPLNDEYKRNICLDVDTQTCFCLHHNLLACTVPCRLFRLKLTIKATVTAIITPINTTIAGIANTARCSLSLL